MQFCMPSTLKPRQDTACMRPRPVCTYVEQIKMEQSANIPGNLKLWSKNTHTGQIYPGLRHTIKIFLATVTVATLILACFIYRSHIRIRVSLHIMPAFSTVEIIQLTGRPPYKYPIHTQRCLSPNRPLPLQIPRSLSPNCPA